MPKQKPEERAKNSDLIQFLKSEGPSTGEELPTKPQLQDKNWIGTLDISSSGTSTSRGRTSSVYYLYGDERRAVRKYIEENEEFVRSCMSDKVNPINIRMENYWWQMFREEWVWGDYDS